MARESANIQSSEVIRDFKNHVIAFDETARQAISGIKSDINKTKEWLKGEQMSFWKIQLRKRTEAAEKAKRELNSARLAPTVVRKGSCVQEQKQLQRAMRSMEEAAEKIRHIRKWIATLDQRLTRMMGPCNSLAAVLDNDIPIAAARLERMAENLEQYFSLE